MTLINAVAFRLPTNRVWQSQNTVLFDSTLYGSSIRADLFIPHFLKRTFEHPHFKKYLWVFSHMTVQRSMNDKVAITVFFYSKFYRGLVRFLYKHMYRLCRKRRSRRYRRLSTLHTFHKALGRLNRNLLRLLTIYRVTILRTINAYNPTSSVSIVFRLLNQRAFPVSYMVNYFAYKLVTGTDLNHTLKSTFTMFEKGAMKGVRGLKVVCAGRFTRKQRAHHSIRQVGFVRTSSLSSKVDYSIATIKLKYGASSIRMWVNYV